MISTQESSPATGLQLSAIAKLCSALKIKESYEENKMTMAEAGQLVRKLEGKVKIERRKTKCLHH